MARNAASTQPSETLRAVVTVLLCLHLMGLGLCLATNSRSGHSALLGTVKSRLFSPWLVPLWLDVGYDTRLTHGLAEDGDHRLEIRRHDADAAPSLVLPSPTMWGERAARWRRLARAVAVAESDPDREALLPAAVGDAAFTPLATRDVTLRVTRHLPPDRGDVLASGVDPAGRREQVYAARVREVGGELQLIKATPREELAPLVKESAP